MIEINAMFHVVCWCPVSCVQPETSLCHRFMQSPQRLSHTSFGWVKPNVDG